MTFWWALPLTLLVFFTVRWLAIKINSPLFNPLFITVIIIIAILLIGNISYDDYFSGNQIINNLLGPAVVALALPLYEQLHQIRLRYKSILLICLSGTLTATITGTLIALMLGASEPIAASIFPKSVTTPIAMAVTNTIGGFPAISATCVLIVGILGAVFGHTILNIFNIKNPAARGLSIGTCAHALGTARCAELDYQEGAYSSLALVMCGIFTSILAPFIYPLVLVIYHWF